MMDNNSRTLHDNVTFGCNRTIIPHSIRETTQQTILQISDYYRSCPVESKQGFQFLAIHSTGSSLTAQPLGVVDLDRSK